MYLSAMRVLLSQRLSRLNTQELVNIILKKQNRIEEMEKILISHKLMDEMEWTVLTSIVRMNWLILTLEDRYLDRTNLFFVRDVEPIGLEVESFTGDVKSVQTL